jgi:Na+-transporting methylmalonyl-CoA/oxaloacetate decarboxylase gamma subunit
MSFIFFLILIFVGWNFFKALKRDMHREKESDHKNGHSHREIKEKVLSKDQVTIVKTINKK